MAINAPVSPAVAFEKYLANEADNCSLPIEAFDEDRVMLKRAFEAGAASKPARFTQLERQSLQQVVDNCEIDTYLNPTCANVIRAMLTSKPEPIPEQPPLLLHGHGIIYWHKAAMIAEARLGELGEPCVTCKGTGRFPLGMSSWQQRPCTRCTDGKWPPNASLIRRLATALETKGSTRLKSMDDRCVYVYTEDKRPCGTPRWCHPPLPSHNFKERPISDPPSKT